MKQVFHQTSVRTESPLSEESTSTAIASNPQQQETTDVIDASTTSTVDEPTTIDSTTAPTADDEPLETIAPAQPIQSPEPIPNPLEQSISSGFESKLDKLLDVMGQFVEIQIQQIQLAQAQSIPQSPATKTRATPIASPKSTPSPQPAQAKADSTETEDKPRKYKTREADATVNAAIDAIIKHNNELGQPHDFKWQISINALKAFSTNQRVIERIVDEGRAEIDAHHEQHQIQPGHNNRHKRKRKIGDVIQL